jgi:hypothetical protein
MTQNILSLSRCETVCMRMCVRFFLPLFSMEVPYLYWVIFSPCVLHVNPYLKTKLRKMPAHNSGPNLSSSIAHYDRLTFCSSLVVLWKKFFSILCFWDGAFLMLLHAACLGRDTGLPNSSFFFILPILWWNLTYNCRFIAMLWNMTSVCLLPLLGVQSLSLPTSNE